jgi:NHLM bacteriocin system ABC transporter peptidase/ATP-binding protein
MRTPVVPQMEDQDCGPACLTSVLRAFGRHASLHEVRATCGVSRDGATAAAVARAAKLYGLEAQGRRVKVDPATGAGLERIAVPSLVVMSGAHFCIFEGQAGQKVLLNDPSLGRYRLSRHEFAQRFDGVAVGFSRGEGFCRGGQRFEFARSLGRRGRPFISAVYFGIVTSLFVAVPGVVASLLLRVFLSGVIGDGYRSWELPICAALAGAAFSVGAGTWLQQWALARALVAMSVDTSSAFLWQMMRLPGTFFHRRQLGGLVTRVQLNDGLAVLLTNRVATAVAGLVTAGIYLGALVWLSPALSLVAVGAAVLNAVAVHVTSKRRTARQHLLQVDQYRRDGVAFAGIAAIETLKAEGAENSFFASWAGWQARTFNTTQSLAEGLQHLLVVPATLNTLATGLIVIVGSVEVLHGQLALGTLLAVQMLLSGFLLPVSSLVGISSDLQVGRAQSTLLDDVLDADVDEYLTPVLSLPPTAPARLRGKLELRDVTFGYDPNRQPVVDGLSLVLEPGQRAAVVGESGSGKSTTARLLAGVLQPWAGEVLFDDQPRSGIPRALVTSGVAYVEQQVRLFDGSVRENLTLWDPTLPDDRLWAALEDARLAELVSQRGGLDARWVRDEARNLSGGERQRMELARALALDPAVLILDEATSALDTETELAVEHNLRRRRCTCVVLAHRLSTVRDADVILVLAGGRVVDRGTHDELAARAGAYRRLLEDLG